MFQLSLMLFSKQTCAVKAKKVISDTFTAVLDFLPVE